MQLGLSSYTFPWYCSTLNTGLNCLDKISFLLQTATQWEISKLQLCENLSFLKLTVSELHQLKTKAGNLGIQLELGTSGLTPSNLHEHIELCKLFDSPFLRMVIDKEYYRPSLEDIVQTITSSLPLLQESGVVLAIENHDRFRAADIKSIIEATDPRWVGVCLDTANSLGCGEGIKTVSETLAPYVVNLHVKDIIIERVPTKMGFTVQGTVAGEGLIDLPGLMTLIQNGRCFTATLEVWSASAETIEETLQNEWQMAQKSIQNLKQILNSQT